MNGRKENDRYVTSNGYVKVRLSNVTGQAAWVLEHRLVMEKSMGRSLLPGENVHHLNGNKQDNRLENLELWVTRQPSGKRPADLVRFAKEILEMYGEGYA